MDCMYILATCIRALHAYCFTHVHRVTVYGLYVHGVTVYGLYVHGVTVFGLYVHGVTVYGLYVCTCHVHKSPSRILFYTCCLPIGCRVQMVHREIQGQPVPLEE